MEKDIYFIVCECINSDDTSSFNALTSWDEYKEEDSWENYDDSSSIEGYVDWIIDDFTDGGSRFNLHFFESLKDAKDALRIIKAHTSLEEQDLNEIHHYIVHSKVKFVPTKVLEIINA